MTVRLFVLIFSALLLSGMNGVNAQGILKKIKEKAENKVVEKVFEGEKQQGEESVSEEQQEESAPGKMANTKGSGLKKTSVDIPSSISHAKAHVSSKAFKSARYEIRQALLGVELEIGNAILKDMPEEVSGIPMVKDEDVVTSSGIGFVGLVIQRVYRNTEKELRVNIANDAAMLSFVNAYLSTGVYSTTADQNVKQMQFQGQQAIIEFDESTGYKLSVPFGQSSLFVSEGVNFNTEEEFLEASNKIDISKIKSNLGEQ